MPGLLCLSVFSVCLFVWLIVARTSRSSTQGSTRPTPGCRPARCGRNRGIPSTRTLAQSDIGVCLRQSELAELDQKVAEMKAEFGRRTAEAEALKLDLIKTQETLDAAQSLLGKLGGEKSRWDSTCEELRAVLASLPTYALLAAAFSTYLGNEPESGRRQVRVTLLSQSSLIMYCSGFI